MKKPVFAAIFLIVGLVVGGILGLYFGAQFARPSTRLLLLGATAFKGTNAIQLYKKGDYAAAREALLEYVKIVEEVSAKPEYGDPKIMRTDLALTFTRLALLEEANGHNDEAKKFMNRALQEATFTRWKEPTDVNLRASVERIDKYKPSAPHD